MSRSAVTAELLEQMEAVHIRALESMWRRPLHEAFLEYGIEREEFGSACAFALTADYAHANHNCVLGAALEGAVAGGDLAGAVGWLESRSYDERRRFDKDKFLALFTAESLGWSERRIDALERKLAGPPRVVEGCDHQVHVTADLACTAAAEGWLLDADYALSGSIGWMVRASADPPAPPAVDVIELDEFEPSFSWPIADAYGIDQALATALHGCLVERPGWRCYIALDEDEAPAAVAATYLDEELPIAKLCWAATPPRHRRRHMHAALLSRRIVDAAAAGYTTLFAELPWASEIEGSADAARIARASLQRAGFREACVRRVWQKVGLPHRVDVGAQI